MAYDPKTKQTVLFGGFVRDGQSDCVLGDTWIWNGEAATWSERTPVTSPPPRYGHAMANGPDGVVLFGGWDGEKDLGDTWVWDGNDWQKRETRVDLTPRSRAAMAFDEARGRTVLFGGDHDAKTLGDTWLWDGRAWSRRSSAPNPGPRGYATMAFHAPTNEVLLQGGWNGHGLPDAWAWNGETWTEEPRTSGTVVAATIAHHRSSGATVLEAGSWGFSYWPCYSPATCNDPVWNTVSDRLEDPPEEARDFVWDGTSWGTPPTGTAPTRKFAAMAEDSAGHLIFFGGYDGADRGDTFRMGTTEVPPPPSPDANAGALRVSVQLERPEIPADGKATVRATATVTRAGVSQPGFPLSFTTSGDVTFAPTSGSTGPDGRLTTTVTASKTPGFETITAAGPRSGLGFPYGGIQDSVTYGSASAVLFETGMALTLTPSAIAADGRSTSVATATVYKRSLADEQVCFSTDGDVTFSAPGPRNCVGQAPSGEQTFTTTITASLTAAIETITARAEKSNLSATAELAEGAGHWIDRTSSAEGPTPGRENAAMAYDEASGATVLFGGYYGRGSAPEPDGTPKVLGDTWI